MTTTVTWTEDGNDYHSAHATTAEAAARIRTLPRLWDVNDVTVRTGEAITTERLTTREAIEALPVGTLGRTARGHLAERFATHLPQCWRVTETFRTGSYPPVRLLDDGPFTVLLRPDTPPAAG